MKCPKCKEELNYFSCIGEAKYDFELDGGDQPLFEEVAVSDDGKDFSCPFCDEPICKTQKEAIELLKGK